MTRKSVLVLDNFPQTLAVVRSLGAAGYHVVLGFNGKKSEAAFSRYCHESWAHPPMDELQEFGTAMRRLLDVRRDIQWIFPVTETSVKLLCQMRDILGREIKTVMVPPLLFEACLDKQKANGLAGSANLLFPKTHVVSDSRQLEEAISTIGFPVIIKAVRSVKLVFGRKAYVITSEDEFNSVFDEWPDEHEDLMVQQFIVGPVEAGDFVAQNGTLIAYCEGCTERTDLLDGTGYGVEFRIVPPSPDLLEATKAFVKANRYTGPGIIQFIRETDTGKIFFLENNPRLSAGVADSIASGQDLPLLALMVIENNHCTTIKEFSWDCEPYKVNHYAYWFSRDLSGYLRQRKDLSKEERRIWLTSMIRSIGRADSHIIWQLRDPVPAIWLLTGLAARFVRRRSRFARRPVSAASGKAGAQYRSTDE